MSLIRFVQLICIFASIQIEAAIPAPSFYERPYVSSAFSSPHDGNSLPFIIAHKSNAPGVPSNTIAAIEIILESDIGGIEMDIQLTKEGIPIVFHDNDLEPMTTGRGPVSNYNIDELKVLRYIHNGQLSDHGIPTLEEVFRTVGKAKILFLDIKDSQILDSGLTAAIAQLIKKYDLYQTVVVETFNPIFLKRLKGIDPKIMVQFDYLEDATPTEEESPEQLQSIPWLLKQPIFHWIVRASVMPDILGVRFSNNKADIRKLAEHGYPIIAWTIDDPDQAQELMQAGVVGIQTNKPFELMEKLRERHQPHMQDASASEEVLVDRILEVQNEQEIADAIALAKKEHKKISVAGAQHSMGGHTYAPGNIILKMYKYNKISYSPETQRLKVQSGATWGQIQEYLDPIGRSIKVMQSDIIFSVGGSISANVHGWQVGSGPLSSTVHQFTLMLASGEVVTCSRDLNPDLFRAVIGGYGLFGVILEVEIETCENRVLLKESKYFPNYEYPQEYLKGVTERGDVQLAYGRLSVAGNTLLQEASLNVFRTSKDISLKLEPLRDESATVLKRKIFRVSEKSEGGKYIRWIAEKRIASLFEKKYQSRNNVMHPDIHVLWREDKDKRDVLQEYFIPKEQYPTFVEALKKRVRQFGVNLLNVTVREVLTDQDSLLSYARNDVFSFVLFLSQDEGQMEEEKMKAFTQQTIDDVLGMGGIFYLPYRLHYSIDQFRQAYPMYAEFIDTKNRYDADEVFTSQFWEYIKQSSSQR